MKPDEPVEPCRWCRDGIVRHWGGVAKVCQHCYQPVAASRPRPQEGDQTRCRWCEGTGVVWFYGGVVRVCTHCYQPVAASSPPTDEVD